MLHHHDTPVPPHDPTGPAGVTVESLRQAVELGRAGRSGYGTLQWPAAVVVADALAVLLDCWEATHPATPPEVMSTFRYDRRMDRWIDLPSGGGVRGPGFHDFVIDEIEYGGRVAYALDEEDQAFWILHAPDFENLDGSDPGPDDAASRCPCCGDKPDPAVWCCDELVQATPDR